MPLHTQKAPGSPPSLTESSFFLNEDFTVRQYKKKKRRKKRKSIAIRSEAKVIVLVYSVHTIRVEKCFVINHLCQIQGIQFAIRLLSQTIVIFKMILFIISLVRLLYLLYLFVMSYLL